ncbi:MAG: hypothetical protein AAFY60_13715 [Myxococcota bacterium]
MSENNAVHSQRWRRAGPLTLRSSMLVSAWVANLRYGQTPRISGAENPSLRVNDFDRLARVLQDRVASVRARIARDVGDVDALRSELAEDVQTALPALAQIAFHEDRPFMRKQMAQMLESLSALEKHYAPQAELAA